MKPKYTESKLRWKYGTFCQFPWNRRLRSPKKKTVNPTISDDRTHGSLFEQRGDKWVALGRQNPAPSAKEFQQYKLAQAQAQAAAKAQAQARASQAAQAAAQAQFGQSRAATQPQNVRAHAAQLLMANNMIPTKDQRLPRYLQHTTNSRELGYRSCSGPFGKGNSGKHFVAHDADQLRPADGHSSSDVSNNHSMAVSNITQSLNNATSPILSTVEVQRLANCLGIPEVSASSLESMQAYISDLQKQQFYIPGTQGSQTVPPSAKEPRRLDIHRIVDADDETRLYLDEPQWVEGDGWVLMGTLPISNIRAYLPKYPEVCFIRCRSYKNSSVVDNEDKDASGNINVKHDSESIIPVEQHLASAIRKFIAFSDCESDFEFSTHDGWNDEFQEFSNEWLDDDYSNITLYPPYRAFYHAIGDGTNTFTQYFNSHELPHFQRVVQYIIGEYEYQFAAIDGLVAIGKITNEYLPFLFKPGIFIVKGEEKNARDYMRTSWLQEKVMKQMSPDKPQQSWMKPRQEESLEEPQQRNKLFRSYTISAWYWDLDPFFKKKYVELKIKNVAINDRSERIINDMDFRPLEHADPKTLKRLQNRGEWAWKCRRRRMIAYHGDTGGNFHQTVIIYWDDPLGASPNAGTDAIGVEAMEHDSPPDDTFVYLTPLSIRGFNLKTKKWCDLFIDGFAEIEAEMSTDIISDKGNGLIMLLHGGPGTGKTLTAESVAEIAQRPLYPVTCGDIGTEPEKVEKYLDFRTTSDSERHLEGGPVMPQPWIGSKTSLSLIYGLAMATNGSSWSVMAINRIRTIIFYGSIS
ncbi:hypothetical protein PG994_003353 [Apiospora phragmitis]|uniref:ATPase AAA-type core domain-containing protein n=1 Tax=Apiospora phragmitis TaxID=2905665 RepID=A0ABR1VXV5_9PEZI